MFFICARGIVSQATSILWNLCSQLIYFVKVGLGYICLIMNNVFIGSKSFKKSNAFRDLSMR